MTTIYGTNGADSLSAYSGSTELQGLDGNDDLRGFNGDDTLDGGVGDDTLVGGAGNDLYVSTQGNDLIDSIQVSGFYASGNDTIRTNLQGSRVVTVRADGDDVVEIGGVDSQADLRFEFIDGLLTVHHKDWQTNPDLGGRLVFRDLAYSESVMLAVDGQSPVRLSDHLRTMDRTIAGTAGDDSLQGTSSADLILGAEGNDFIFSSYGQDTVFGGMGNDWLVGGGGQDLASGAEGNDSLDGVDDNDTLLGGVGQDTLRGGKGNDSLDGGDGADVFQIWSDDVEAGGSDTLHADGQDTIVFRSVYNDGSDSVNLDLSWGTVSHGELTVHYRVAGKPYASLVIDNALDASGLTLVSGSQTRSLDDLLQQAVYQIDGSAGNDSLTGGLYRDSVHGLGGDDQLLGGAGNDALNGDDGADLLDGGDGDDGLHGDAGNDILWGGAGVDVVSGDEGDDVMDGGAGADLLFADAGQDTMTGGEGADNFVFFKQAAGQKLIHADGQDLISLYAYSSKDLTLGTLDASGPDTLQFNLKLADSSASVSFVLDHFSTLAGITLAFADTNLSWDDIQARIPRAPANLTLTGTAKADTLNGAAGNDTLSGLAGNDKLSGGAGHDRVDGGAGNDTLAGNTGNDTLIGGKGNDTYLFAKGDGQDRIIDNDSTLLNSDVLKISGAATQQLWFKRTGNDLEIDILGTQDKAFVQDWFVGSSNRIEKITAADSGKSLSASKVNSLVSAMASFQIDPSASSTLPSNTPAAITRLVASSWA